MLKENKIKCIAVLIIIFCFGCFYSCKKTDGTEVILQDNVVESSNNSENFHGETSKIVENVDGSKSTSDAGNESVFYVYITGSVNYPGVYEVSEGSRIFNVIEAAGGTTREAALEYIDMAAYVSDGCSIHIYSLTEALDANLSISDGGSYIPSSSENSSNTLVNINTASLEELMTLSGIGQSKAQSIITYRQEHGGFKSIEEIMDISGIKEAAFGKIKDNICVK